MKKYILNILTIALVAASIQTSFAEAPITTYSGKSAVTLKYWDFGWNSSLCPNNDIAIAWSVGLVLSAGIIPIVVQPLICLEDYDKIKTVNAKFELTIKDIGNQRVTLNLSSEAKKNCSGFSLPMIGEGDGFGNYELFKTNEDYIANKSVGRMTSAGNYMYLDLDQGRAATQGKDGHSCVWEMNNGIHIKMKIQE
ncbi:MAG: hypothetical protein AB7I27_04110 [Bacteriovoracaceae bacterium]